MFRNAVIAASVWIAVLLHASSVPAADRKEDPYTAALLKRQESSESWVECEMVGCGWGLDYWKRKGPLFPVSLPADWARQALKDFAGCPDWAERLKKHWETNRITVTRATPFRLVHPEVLLVRTPSDFVVSKRERGFGEYDFADYIYYWRDHPLLGVRLGSRPDDPYQPEPSEPTSRFSVLPAIAVELSLRSFLLEQGYSPVLGRNDGAFSGIEISDKADGTYFKVDFRGRKGNWRIHDPVNGRRCPSVGAQKTFAQGDQLLVLYREPALVRDGVMGRICDAQIAALTIDASATKLVLKKWTFVGGTSRGWLYK